jgi:hypothetical protein
MRSAAQISRTPREWVDLQTERRRRTLAALLRELAAARRRREEWYEWMRARAERRHVHGLRDEAGRAIACPFPGCDHERGTVTPHLAGDGRSRRSTRQRDSA